MVSHNRRRTVYSLISICIAMGACGDLEPDRAVAVEHPVTSSITIPNDCAFKSESTAVREGEIFGQFYVNEVQACNQVELRLEPIGSTAGRLFNNGVGAEDLTGYSHWHLQWEWWDPLGGAECSNSANRSVAYWKANGSTYPEEYHSVDRGMVLESHCVRPGAYTFSVSANDRTRSYEIDYMQGGFQTVYGVGADTFRYTIASNGYDTEGGYIDHYSNVDFSTVALKGDTARLDLQFPSGGLSDPVFSNQTSPSGNGWQSLRASAGRSVTNWNGNRNDGYPLAKIWWNYYQDTSLHTNYFPINSEGVRVLRYHRYQNPTNAIETLTVAMDLMSPDEEPGGPEIFRTIVLNRVGTPGGETQIPNLVPGGTWAPPEYIARGEPLSVVLGQKNLGTATATGSWKYYLYTSSDSACCGETDVMFDSVSFTGPLSVSGTATTTSSSITFPGSLGLGEYHVFMRVDGLNVIEESSDDDNTKWLGKIRLRECVWDPLYIHVNTGGHQGMGNSGSCSGRAAKITPASAVGGFNVGCTSFAKPSGPFNIRGCADGQVILQFYTDNTYTTLEQEIVVDVGPL